MRHDSTSVALEAAHIKWKQHGGPCEISNGLALCAIHHKAFDKGSIGLDESMRVQVSRSKWQRHGGQTVLGFCREGDCSADNARELSKRRVCGMAQEGGVRG
jgi:hypothetical protein